MKLIFTQVETSERMPDKNGSYYFGDENNFIRYKYYNAAQKEFTVFKYWLEPVLVGGGGAGTESAVASGGSGGGRPWGEPFPYQKVILPISGTLEVSVGIGKSSPKAPTYWQRLKKHPWRQGALITSLILLVGALEHNNIPTPFGRLVLGLILACTPWIIVLITNIKKK